MKKISYGLLLLISFFCRGENIVFQENFDTAPNSKKWQLKFKSYPDKTYTASRILKKELSLQDFYWGGDIATAKSPEFAPCETWQIEFDLCFQSVPSGKKKDYQYKIQLLTANGEISVEFPILCDGKTPGGKLLGKIPLEEKKYYRITATRKYQDQRFDIIAEDKQSGKKSSLQDISFTRDIPVVRLCFQAVTGWDCKGIMAIDNIVIKTFGKPVKRIFKAVTFMKNDFLSLAVSADGKTEICDKNGQQLFILGVPELPGQIQASSFKPVKLQNDNPTSPVVYYETIATSTHLAGSQNQVLGVEAYDSNGKKLYLMQWTLFKKGARLRILPQLILNENRHKNIAGIPFFPAVGYREVNRFAPMRLFQHPTGGEPTDEVRGQIVDFQSFAIGIAGNMPDAWNFYKKDNIRFEIKNTQMAFGKDFPCGTVAFSLRSNPQARRREILARAGDERLVMEFSHPHPFFISDHPGTWQGDIHIGNYFRKKQRCSVNYTARDYNGTIIASGKFSEVLAEDQETVFPLKLNLDKPGPVYIELFGHHESGGDYIRICGGYLPRYDFKAGKESRIGVSAFRGTVGAHTEKRTPEEFFRFMKHMGISLTRMAYGVEDTAHKHGIRTWMHLNIANDAHTRDYFDRKRTTWLNIPENREKYLKAQMQRAANSGAEVYEFSNEWNLHGGDNRAHRAELYAKDWLPLIKKLRDKYFPQLKIGGLVIANADMPYMQKVYENGGWQLFDYLVFHASGVPRSAENDDNYWSYFRTLKNIRKALNKYGEKPLYISELYIPVAPNISSSNNERISADDLALQLALATVLDVKNIMIYCFDDFDRPGCTGFETTEPLFRERYFGMVRKNYVPKATVWACATAAKFFDPGSFLGDISLNSRHLYGLLFDRGPNGKFAFIWSRKDGLRSHEVRVPLAFHRPPWEKTDVSDLTPLKIKAPSGSLKVTDVVGVTTVHQADRDGFVTVPVGESPLYIEGGEFTPHKGFFYQNLIAGKKQ